MMEKKASEFEEGKAVLYIPNHVRVMHNGDKKHQDVERGIVVGNNDASCIVFVRFGNDIGAKACYPRDLEYDVPDKEVKDALAVGAPSSDSKAQDPSGGAEANLDKRPIPTR